MPEPLLVDKMFIDKMPEIIIADIEEKSKHLKAEQCKDAKHKKGFEELTDMAELTWRNHWENLDQLLLYGQESKLMIYLRLLK